jgi:hypothetical protein
MIRFEGIGDVKANTSLNRYLKNESSSLTGDLKAY